MQRNLIIFMKRPMMGQVKTRLAADIGDETALEVYRELLQKCRMACEEVESSRYLFYHPEIDLNDSFSNVLFTKRKQAVGDLGAKMKDAFQSVLAESNDPTIIIGTDCYDLDASQIEKAFQELDKNDLVIGPANDGGYYLLGIKQYEASLFEEINWSTSTVFDETTQKAKDASLSISVLEELIDLDTFDDLKSSSFPWNEMKK